MPLLTPHVPKGLIELMKDLAKEVLRDKPENIYEFAIVHFEKLILERDGRLDKGYEEFTAFENFFDGQQRFAVPSNCGYICQKPIKIQAIPQPRKSKADIMASFQAMESINEEDVLAPAPEAENPYADEKYQNAIYVIQRYFRRYVARKKENEGDPTQTQGESQTLSAFTAAIIIQRTMRRLFSNKIKLKKDKDLGTALAAATTAAAVAAAATVKLVQDDVDNVSEAASYTSSSTIQMLADGQEGRENRLASAQSRRQREEVSDGDGDEDGENGVGVDVVGAVADFSSIEFKELTQDVEELEPPSSSSVEPAEAAAKLAVVAADDEDDEKEHSHSSVAMATEADRKSIADENGNTTVIPEETTNPASASTTDDTSTAHNIGILSTKIGSNYNHQNLTNTKTHNEIVTNTSRTSQPPPTTTQIYKTKQQLLHQIIPAGLSVPLNSPQFSSSTTTSSSSSLLGATPTKSPHLEETQETLTVHRFHDYGNGNANENENPNGKTNDALLPPPYFQGDGRIRKFDSDTGGESLKIYDVFYHQDTSINDQEFSDSLNESTMEKDSLEPEELDADSLESNENVMHHHMSEIVKRDAKQDDGSLYGDKNDDEEKDQEVDDNDNDNAQSMQKFIEIERVPTYLYGIHPARTPVVERRNKSRNCEEAQSKVPDDEKKYLEVTVDSKTPDEKSEENSLESKGSTSEESSVTQIENNLQHQQSEIENKGSKLNEVSDNDGKVPTKSPESEEKMLNIGQKASSLITEKALLRENEINLEKSNEMLNHKVEESGQNALEMSSNQAFDGSVTSCEDVNQQNEANLSLNNGPSSSNSHIKSNSETARIEDGTILEKETKTFEVESENSKQEANESEKTLNCCDNVKENALVPSVKSDSEKLIDSERGSLPKNIEESNLHQGNQLKLVSLDSNQSQIEVKDSKDELEKFISNESISPNSKSSEDQPKMQTHIENISTQLTDDESARMKLVSQSEALKNEEDCVEDQTKIHTHIDNNPIHLSNDDSEMMKTSKNEEDIVEDHLKIHTQNEKNITNLPDDGSEIIKSAGQSAPLKNGEDMLEDQPKIQNDIANKSIHLSDENSESMKTAEVLKSDEAIIEDQLKIQTHIENNASHLPDNDSETIKIAGQSEALKNDENIVLQEQHKENIEKYEESSSKDIKTESIQNSVLETSLNSKTIEDQNKNLLDHDQEIESQLQELQNLNDDLHPDVENAHHVMSADTKNDNISQHNGKNNMEDSFNQSNELKITNETKNNEDSTIKISKNPPTEILNSSNIAEDELSKLNASANSKISDSNQIEKSEDHSTEKCQNTHKEEECNVIEVDKTELNDLSEASKETIEEENNQISKEKVMPEEDKKHKEKSLKSDSQSEEDVDKIFKDNSKEGELEMKLGTTNNLVSLKETNEGGDAKVSQKAPSMHSNMEETEELKEDQTTLRKNSNEDTNFIKGLNNKEEISDANLVEISKTITEDHQSDIKTKEDHHLSVESTGNQKKNTLKGEDPDKESHENEKENTKLFDSEDLHATQDQDKALKLTGKDQTSNECTSLDINIEENRIKTLKENEAAERSILEKAKSNEGIASDITSENIEDSLNKKLLTGILNETNMPISSETNEETNKQNEDVQEKTLADKEVSSKMKETEAENDKEIEEPKPSSNNSPNNTDPEKENTFQGTSPSNDNIFNEPHSLKKPDNIDSIPSASPENIGCDGSSAETSADFSSIGKDLEFFEDTIKYLKNATEHLGGMEEVFDSKKNFVDASKNTDLLNNSAVLIQSAFRGYQVRRDLKELKALEKTNEVENGSRKKRSLDQEETSSDSNEEKNVKAAIKIQSAYRGHRVRKNLKEKPNKETTESIEDLQSPSRHILASNSLKSQIPVAVIHPTKYSNSSEEDKTEKVAGIRNTTTSRNSFNSNQKNSKTSPHKTTSLKRQKPVGKRPNFKNDTSDERNEDPSTSQKSSKEVNEQTFVNNNLDQTIKMDKTLILGNRKLINNGNKSRNLKTKTFSVSEDMLQHARGSNNVRTQFERKGKSLSTNGKVQNQETFDLEKIKEELLSNTVKTPPQSGSKKKKVLRIKSGKQKSPKKQNKGTKIPQKSPSKIIEKEPGKQAEIQSEETTKENIEKNETDLSKTFIKESVSDTKEADSNIPKTTLNKTYTMRSSLNEVENLSPQLETLNERAENGSEDLFDSLKKDVDKLKSDVQEKSAVTIQKTFRGFKTRKGLKNKGSKVVTEILPTVTETVLINNEESSSEEKEAMGTVRETEEESSLAVTENLEKAATNIQKTYRGYKTRKNYKTIKEEISKLKIYNLDVEAEKVPSEPNLKSSEDCPEQPLNQVEEESAIKEGKKTLKGDKVEEIEEKSSSILGKQDDLALDKAATNIQKTYRGYKSRKNYQAFKEQRNKLKSNNFEAEKNSKGPKLPISLEDNSESSNQGKEESATNEESKKLKEDSIQEKEEDNSDLALNKAATNIQKTYRGYKTRKDYRAIKEEKSKLKTDDVNVEYEKVIKERELQTAFDDNPEKSSGGNLEKSNESKPDLEKPSEENSEESSIQSLEKSALTIQKTFRGYQTRKELKSRTVSQTAIKENNEKNEADDEKPKPSGESSSIFESLQKSVEGYKSSVLDKSATTIQKHFRGYRTRNDLNKRGVRSGISNNTEDNNLLDGNSQVNEEEEKIIDKSTDLESNVQSEAPIEKGTKESALKTEMGGSEDKASSDLNKSATTIQKNFRGYQTRKQLKTEKADKQKIISSGEITEDNGIKEKIGEEKTSPNQKRGAFDSFDVEEFHNEALEKSAVTIQKTFRGYKTRKDLQSNTKEDQTQVKVSNEDQDQTNSSNSNKKQNIEEISVEQNVEKLAETTVEAEDHISSTEESSQNIDSSENLLQKSNSDRKWQQESSKSLSAEAILENAASTIQKSYRDYQMKKNNLSTKSYSNGIRAAYETKTTHKEGLEHSDESSTFIGPDTSFDLSDVDSVETKSEKTLEYDKINTSESHTPVNNEEDGQISTFAMNIQSEDKEIDNEDSPKLRLKRHIIEPTAPPLDEIVTTEDSVDVSSPKLKWFVGEDPIIPSDSSSSSPVNSLISSSASSSSKLNNNNLSSIDACREINLNSNQQLAPSINDSTVVSTSSLLLHTNKNTEIINKNTLNKNSRIVSANNNEEEEIIKEDNNLGKIVQNEDIAKKSDENDEEDGASSSVQEDETEKKKEDHKEVTKEGSTELCKNCAEGIHQGGICSEDLIKSSRNEGQQFDPSDPMKHFVLMEELNQTNKSHSEESSVILSQKEEEEKLSSESEVDSSNVALTPSDLIRKNSQNEDVTEELKSSIDCPVISLIPPSSEDDISERESINEAEKKDEEVKQEKTENNQNEDNVEMGEENKDRHEPTNEESQSKTQVEKEDIATIVDSKENKEDTSSGEKRVQEVEADKEVTESLNVSKTNGKSDENVNEASLSKRKGSDDLKQENPVEDAFKTRPGEEFAIKEHGFEDDFSDSKDIEDPSEDNTISTVRENKSQLMEEDTLVKSEEMDKNEDTNESTIIQKEKTFDDKEKDLEENPNKLKDLQNSVTEEDKDSDKSGEKHEISTDRQQNSVEDTTQITQKKEDIKGSKENEDKSLTMIDKMNSEVSKEDFEDTTEASKAKAIIEDKKDSDKKGHGQLSEDMEIAAKLIESSLSDPQAKLLEKQRKVSSEDQLNKNHSEDQQESSKINEDKKQPDSQVEAKLEKLIEDNLKPTEDTTNTIDPKDLPTENSSHEVIEEPCVKKIAPPTPYTGSSDPDESELESTTTKAESTTTTPGYDETSETDALDMPTSNPDTLEAMTEKLREPEEMVARMHQRRASEHQISMESVTDQQGSAVFEEPICEPIKPMQKIQKSSSTDVEDDFVLQKLQRGDTTRESSAQSESVVFGDTTSQQATESEDTFNENMDLHSLHRMNTMSGNRSTFKPTSHLSKSVTIDDTVKYIDPVKSTTEESGSSFCMDDALSEDVRKKMMAYSVSEADSDYYDVGDQTNHPHDDFNISTALDTFPSTDTDTTIVSAAATKIQAGARGFLTRRRIRRASMGTKTSLTEEEKNLSFGSLDQLAEEEVGRRQFNRQTGVNSLPSALEHSDETLSPLGEDIQTPTKHSPNKTEAATKIATSSSNDVNNELDKPEDDDDSFQIANLDSTVARRLTLQRGDALRNDSTPDDENGGGGNGKQVDLAKNTVASAPTGGKMYAHERTMVESTTTTTTTRTTTERRNYSDAAVSSKKEKIKWFALRQNSMPVQIDSEVFRVLPKHMRKRIKSAEGEKPKRIRLPRD